MIQSLWLRLSVPCVIQLLCCLLLCHQAGIDQAITGARAPNCTIRVFCGQLPVEVSASDDNLLRGLIILSSSAVPIAARSEKEVRCQKLVFTCARSALLLAHCATILCVCVIISVFQLRLTTTQRHRSDSYVETALLTGNICMIKDWFISNNVSLLPC